MKTKLNPTKQKIKDSLDKTELFTIKETCNDNSYMRVCIPMKDGDDLKSIHYCSRKYLNCTLQELRKLNDIININIDDNTLHLSINGDLRKHVKKTYNYDTILLNSPKRYQEIFNRILK
jgi:hypothetical protein